MDNNQRLKEDLQRAIKSQDTLRKRVLRLLISTIQLAEIAKGTQLSDPEFIAVVHKEIKTKLDTIADAEKAGRALIKGEADRGVVMCGSGIGVSITLNRMKAIYGGRL